MEIFFRKPIEKVSTEILNKLIEVDAKKVDVITANINSISVSLNGLTKKEIANFLNADFYYVKIGEKNILKYAIKPAVR